MERTSEGNGFPNKSPGAESKHIADGITPLRAIAGGLQPHHKQSQQRAQVRRFTALLNTTAALFAHEVASPLQGMAASLQLIERDLKTNHNPLLTTNMRSFRREVDRLITLLDEFRSASVQKLNLTGSDLRQVVEDALAIQLIFYQTAGVNLRFDFKDGLPAVKLDTAKIKQVILNLCRNALDAMPQGGDLTIRGYSLGATVVLEIADTGIGMPEGIDPFALFQTTKVHGSGLGLPIVEQIVLAHNGTIDYTSEPGRGTTFKIVFPAAV